MIKNILPIMLIALLFNACNSDKNKEEVEYIAYQICEGMKRADISAMKPYITASKQADIGKFEKLFHALRTDKRMKKEFKAYLEKMSTTDCISSNILNEQPDGTFVVSNPQIRQIYTLGKIDGSWKIVSAQ